MTSEYASHRHIKLDEYSAVRGPCSTNNDWSLENFAKDFNIVITNICDGGYTMEFDMIGIDASIANAFRRILIAEVPTMAVDKVFIYNNTSVIYDEVLAHRIGLLPIKVDPRLFEYKPEGDDEGSAEDTIEFELKVKCTKTPHPSKDACAPSKLYSNYEVCSGDLKFIPKGEQLEMYGQIRPVDKDILLAKLRPGQEIDLKAHCVKGIGKDHAKFSPVATASYRLLPEIKLLQEITGKKAHRVAECFTDGVIKVVKRNGKEVAIVANARKDMSSRNIFYDDELRDLVSLSKVKDHFIFTIESTGILPSDVLFLEAVGVLREKCRTFLKELQSLKIQKRK